MRTLKETPLHRHRSATPPTGNVTNTSAAARPGPHDGPEGPQQGWRPPLPRLWPAAGRRRRRRGPWRRCRRWRAGGPDGPDRAQPRRRSAGGEGLDRAIARRHAVRAKGRPRPRAPPPGARLPPSSSGRPGPARADWRDAASRGAHARAVAAGAGDAGRGRERREGDVVAVRGGAVGEEVAEAGRVPQHVPREAVARQARVQPAVPLLRVAPAAHVRVEVVPALPDRPLDLLRPQPLLNPARRRGSAPGPSARAPHPRPFHPSAPREPARPIGTPAAIGPASNAALRRRAGPRQTRAPAGRRDALTACGPADVGRAHSPRPQRALREAVPPRRGGAAGRLGIACIGGGAAF